jgi:hypothetical protein
VEVQVDHGAVVATDDAATPRFRDEGPLDTLMPARHRLAHTALAPHPAVPVSVKNGRTVTRADVLES